MRRLWQDLLVGLGLRKRLELEFSESGMKILNELALEKEITRAEVIRRSLALSALCSQAAKEGKRIMVLSQSGVPIKELVMFRPAA